MNKVLDYLYRMTGSWDDCIVCNEEYYYYLNDSLWGILPQPSSTHNVTNVPCPNSCMYGIYYGKVWHIL